MESCIWGILSGLCFAAAGWIFGKYLGESYTIKVRCIKEAEKFFEEEEKKNKDDSNSK